LLYIFSYVNISNAFPIFFPKLKIFFEKLSLSVDIVILPLKDMQDLYPKSEQKSSNVNQFLTDAAVSSSNSNNLLVANLKTKNHVTWCLPNLPTKPMYKPLFLNWGTVMEGPSLCVECPLSKKKNIYISLCGSSGNNFVCCSCRSETVSFLANNRVSRCFFLPLKWTVPVIYLKRWSAGSLLDAFSKWPLLIISPSWWMSAISLCPWF